MRARRNTGLNPKNDEALAGGAVQGFSGVAQSVSQHPIADDLQRKAFTTLQAKFAMLGFSLNQLSSGGFLVGKWGRARHLSDLNEVNAFLRQVGGAN